MNISEKNRGKFIANHLEIYGNPAGGCSYCDGFAISWRNEATPANVVWAVLDRLTYLKNQKNGSGDPLAPSEYDDVIIHLGQAALILDAMEKEVGGEKDGHA
jgi:hypothetical protein